MNNENTTAQDAPDHTRIDHTIAPEDNWLAWMDNPSERDLEILAEVEARALRVGPLLHEVHYLLTTKPHPKWDPVAEPDERQFLIDYVRAAPGLSEEGIRKRISDLKKQAAAAADDS